MESCAITDVASASPLPSPVASPSTPLDRELAAHRAVDRFRDLSVTMIASCIALSIAIGLLTRVQTSVDGTMVLTELLAALLLGSSLLWKPSGIGRVCADLSGTVGVTALAGFAGAVVGMLGLRLHFPLTDRWLRAADLMIGFDGVRVIEWMSGQQPWFFRLMHWAYNYTLPLLALTTIVFCLVRRVEAWRMTFCFTGTLMTSCAISIVIPAKAMAVWMSPAVLARLPGCAMRCFYPTFDAFYSQPGAVLALKNIDGVLTFPSFHAAMGCIIFNAWRASIVTIFLGVIWFSFMMMGALAIGGHYGIDLVGGCLVWWAWFAFSRRLECGEGSPTGFGRVWRARQESNLRPHA